MKKTYVTLAVIGFVTVVYSSVLVFLGCEVLTHQSHAVYSIHYPYMIDN
jgi:hypothetical protein